MADDRHEALLNSVLGVNLKTEPRVELQKTTLNSVLGENLEHRVELQKTTLNSGRKKLETEPRVELQKTSV